jgi:hypothetical protein
MRQFDLAVAQHLLSTLSSFFFRVKFFYDYGHWQNKKKLWTSELKLSPILASFFITSGLLSWCKHETLGNEQHCKENPIYVFLFWELRGLIPNFHIQMFVSDLKPL